MLAELPVKSGLRSYGGLLLMGVLKEMGAHRDLSVCIKVEG